MVRGGDVEVDGGTLCNEVRGWHGILVVATQHGHLHLVDLALDQGNLFPKVGSVIPPTLKVLTITIAFINKSI